MGMSAKGHNGDVLFDGTAIVITRGRVMTSLFGRPDRKHIVVEDVTAVRWAEPTALVNGYLAFTIPGSSESNRRRDIANDDNAVLFTRGQRDNFQAIREVIEESIANSPRPVRPQTPA